MKYEAIPEEHWKRKAIYVLDKYQLENALRSDEADELRDDEYVCLVGYPLTGDSEICQTLREKGDLTRGAILIQNPYDKDRYVTLDDATDRIALEKYMYFSHFCQLLGATEVKVVIAQKISQKKALEARLEGGMLKPTGKGDGAVDFEMQKFQETLNQMHLADKYPGGEADIQSAESLLNDRGLQNDGNLHSLLLARKHTGNRILSRELEINLSEELRNTLHAVVSVNTLLPAAAISVKSSFAHSLEELYEYRLKVEVIFA